ncbi:MAG: HD domain-containing protein, partial [Erysipelotrichaceae bacterium]|nr:HD domain-containing protein [Erysipelotrichaceae bacterium]
MLKEKRVIRDPIHGYIHINDELIWSLINTREFQRLRRIRQLGSTSVVFPSGTHTRHLHSLGCYEVARRMLEEVKNLGECLNEREKRAALAAALLHDIGHAPFSHSFEAILKCRHEFYTVQIIRGPSEVNDVLNSVDDSFAEEVAQILEHSHPNKILSQIISSQLDADRLDYLLRDSYCTGTIYGKVDLDRILRTMRVRDNVLAVKQSSIYTVENYIMSRYHMYWQVYYHPTSRSFDSILKSLFLRLKDLHEDNHDIVKEYPMYKALLENEVLNNDDFFLLDDETCSYSFNLMRNSSDPIL